VGIANVHDQRDYSWMGRWKIESCSGACGARHTMYTDNRISSDVGVTSGEKGMNEWMDPLR
jgi:hypothetical protein